MSLEIGGVDGLSCSEIPLASGQGLNEGEKKDFASFLTVS